MIKKEAILKSMKNIPAELLEDVGENGSFQYYPKKSTKCLFQGIYLAQRMSADKRSEYLEAVENLGTCGEKSVSPSPSNASEGDTGYF